MQLPTSIESFSLGKVIEIFHAFQATEGTQKVYESDFSEDTTICSNFDMSSKMAQLAGGVYNSIANQLDSDTDL